VATFQETPSKAGKVWVKAGTYDAGRRRKYTIAVFRFVSVILKCGHELFLGVSGNKI
jgi:hypothetical protein